MGPDDWVRLQAENERLKARVSELEKTEAEQPRPGTAFQPSESQFRTLVNASPFGIQLTDDSGKIVYSNPAHHRIQGCPHGQLIGKFIWDLLADEQQANELKKYYQFIIDTQPEPTPYFSQDRTQDGRLVDIQVNWDYVRDAAGGVEGIISIISDISERIMSEAAARDSEFRFQDLINTISSGVAVYEVINDGQGGSDYIIRDFNRASLEMEGLKKEEVLGKNLADLRPNIEDFGLIPVFRKVWKTGEPAFFPAKAYVDEKFYAFYENRVYKLPSGEIVAVYDDVTDRETAVAQLKESEARFEYAMEATRDGLFDWDLVTNEIYYSPGWKRMVGYEVDELPNDFSVWEKLTDPEDVARSWAMQEELLNRQRDRFELEFKMKHKDGHWVDILSRAQALFDEEGKALRIVGTHVDISDRKAAELEKESLQNQLLQSQKMESIGRLAGGVAHDFNNQLSVIQGYTELSLEEATNAPDLQDHLKQIMSAARRSKEITGQLLAFARKQTIAPGLIDLNQVVDSLLQMLKRLIGEDVLLDWAGGTDLWPIKMDKAQVDQVLANLVVNARDAISGVGKITISTQNVTLKNERFSNRANLISGEFVRLAVSDDGCGMDDETQNMLFEPFFTTKKLHQGTGLGMSMVYGIAMQNDGLIRVESQIDEGTSIKLYLPRSNGAVLSESAMIKSDVPQGCGETVLLVEDEEAICEMTTTLLKRLGYKVLAATTPKAALELTREHQSQIQLLFSDVILPQMNGKRLAKEVAELIPGIKTLFMSGYTADVIAHRGVLDDDVQFISKPFTRKELAKKVRESLDMDAGGQGT